MACLQGELSAVMPNFLSDRDDLSHDPEDSSTASVSCAFKYFILPIVSHFLVIIF